MLGTVSSSLAASVTKSDDGTVGIVTATELNVRDQRSTSGNVLYKLKLGTKVNLLDLEKNWYQLEYEGKKGFASANYIQLAQKAPEDSNESSLGSTASPATTKPASAVTPAPTGATEEGDYVTLRSGSTGDAVSSLQERLKVLKYYTAAVDGSYGKGTVSAVKAFQKKAGLSADGIAGPLTQAAIYDDAAPEADAKESAAEDDTNTDTSGDYVAPTPNITSVKMTSWWDSGVDSVQKAFPRKSTATVTDVKSGVTFTVYRRGGTNHADVETLTKDDTKQMRKVYTSWSWDRRAVWVTMENGVTYAGSMNGKPHGEASIDNNGMDGHFCIHFFKSRTHGTNSQCSLHQAATKLAYETGCALFGDGGMTNDDTSKPEGTKTPTTSPSLNMDEREVIDLLDEDPVIPDESSAPEETPAPAEEDGLAEVGGETTAEPVKETEKPAEATEAPAKEEPTKEPAKEEKPVEEAKPADAENAE